MLASPQRGNGFLATTCAAEIQSAFGQGLRRCSQWLRHAALAMLLLAGRNAAAQSLWPEEPTALGSRNESTPRLDPPSFDPAAARPKRTFSPPRLNPFSVADEPAVPHGSALQNAPSPRASDRVAPLATREERLAQTTPAAESPRHEYVGEEPGIEAETPSLFSPRSRATARSDWLGAVRSDGDGSGAENDGAYRPDMPAKDRKLTASFGDGLTVRTNDDYFALTFHNLTQVDLRIFNPTGDPLADNFVIPRQRWYFEGHVSEYVSYYTVVNQGYGTFEILDAFVDFNFAGRPQSGQRLDQRPFELRVGRMKTPYTYEYIQMAENNLIAAERSVFVGNVAGNRQLGIMAHGRLFDDQVQYAVGVFNGPRRSFQDFNNGKDLYTYLNTRPFLKTGSEALEQLNLGGSFNFGRQHNPLQPSRLQTANDQAAGDTAASVSPAFLVFNPSDIENGLRMQWSGDVTYYFRSLGIMSGYQGGFQDYSTSPTTPVQTRVPMSGYEVTVFYFLTGEEITVRRNLLEPRSPLGQIGYVRGEPSRGIGAIELFTRFANMHLGGVVLSSGLATTTSANNANVIDTGFNWYLNHYAKLTFDWQYSAYNRPVALTPHSTTTFNNLFWLRAQIFF